LCAVLFGSPVRFFFPPVVLIFSCQLLFSFPKSSAIGPSWSDVLNAVLEPFGYFPRVGLQLPAISCPSWHLRRASFIKTGSVGFADIPLSPLRQPFFFFSSSAFPLWSFPETVFSSFPARFNFFFLRRFSTPADSVLQPPAGTVVGFYLR